VKIEVRCGGCGRGYLVDAAKVPPSGTVQACQTCGTAIEVRPLSSRTPPLHEEEPPGAAATQPVICPRCGLHFTPDHAPAPPLASRRARVLLVEDMEFFQDIARQALEATADVVSVTSVSDARRALAQGRFDLLLLDLALEGEDGRDLLRSLPFKPCPILIFTARDESDMYGEAWSELQEYGADDVVVKGMQMGETLARKVAALLAPAV